MAWAWSAWAGDPPFSPSDIALHGSSFITCNSCSGAAAHAWGPGDDQQGIQWHGPDLLGQMICQPLAPCCVPHSHLPVRIILLLATLIHMQVFAQSE